MPTSRTWWGSRRVCVAGRGRRLGVDRGAAPAHAGPADPVRHDLPRAFQYYTVLTAQRALASGGLALVDVELLDTHGGSVRLWARPTEALSGAAGEPSQAVHDVFAAGAAAGLRTGGGRRRVAPAGSPGGGEPGGVPGGARPGRE